MFTEMIYYGRLSMIEIALSRHAPPKNTKTFFLEIRIPVFGTYHRAMHPPKNTKTFFLEIRIPVFGT